MQAEQITHSSGTHISMVDIRSNGIVFSLIIKQRLSSPLFATPAPNSSSKASGEDYSLVGVYLHKYHFFPEDCTRRLKSNDSTVSSFSQEISITPGRSRTYWLFLINWENNRDCHTTMPLSLKTMDVQIKGDQWNKRFTTVHVYCTSLQIVA